MERDLLQRDQGTPGRRLSVVVVTMATLVALGACSRGTTTGSASLSRAAPTSTTTTSTSVPETTTTTARPGSETTPTTRVTTPPRQPQADPWVTTSPSGAAPQTRVSITGEGFTAEHWKMPNVSLWLAGGPSSCDFFAEADHEVRVGADGHLTGSFVVPSYGNCRQSSIDGIPVAPGRYRIVYQCTACTIGEFEVTVSAPPASETCQNVGFTPNSDDLASDIVAYGLPCSEAEAVVRKVGGPLGPINGDPTGEADGFTCVRTSQYEGQGLPTATYECTRGEQRITFIRT